MSAAVSIKIPCIPKSEIRSIIVTSKINLCYISQKSERGLVAVKVPKLQEDIGFNLRALDVAFDILDHLNLGIGTKV